MKAPGREPENLVNPPNFVFEKNMKKFKKMLDFSDVVCYYNIRQLDSAGFCGSDDEKNMGV